MALRCEDCEYTRFLKCNKKPFEGRRWWRCGRCGHIQLGYRQWERQQPRELYIDIETAPNIALLYDLHIPGKYVNPDMILQDWFILSWSAQWMNCYKHQNFSAVVSPQDARNGSDKKILKLLRELMSEADLIWGHNYKKFDRKKINTRLLINKIEPPERYKMVDTLQIAKSHFSFASSRLAFINDRLGNNGKLEMKLDDWKQSMKGDPRALAKMVRYNIGDVKEGIAMVKKLREWIVPFPKLMGYIREEG